MHTDDRAAAQQDGPASAKRPKPTVRGGFVVIGRTEISHRLTLKNDRPHEHPSLDSALTEAARLATRHGREFAVFEQVGAALPPARDEATP